MKVERRSTPLTYLSRIVLMLMAMAAVMIPLLSINPQWLQGANGVPKPWLLYLLTVGAAGFVYAVVTLLVYKRKGTSWFVDCECMHLPKNEDISCTS